MNWEWLGTGVDIIILIGALCLAVERIFKPLLKLRRRGEENFEERVVDILNRRLPDILLAHDLETREKYKQDRYNYLCQIKDEVLKCIKTELEQVDELNL
jgi:disulfide oxidoreductase YuzD